jgi:hypothetical protein
VETPQEPLTKFAYQRILFFFCSHISIGRPDLNGRLLVERRRLMSVEADTETDHQPQRGDRVIAASPGAPTGHIATLYCKGRVSVATEAGLVSIQFRRLVWSRKHRAWRCFSAEVMRLADAPAPRLPAPGDLPLLGEYVKLDDWPLAGAGWVTRQIEVRKGLTTTALAFILATRRGPLTAMREVLIYDVKLGCWRANVGAWARSK